MTCQHLTCTLTIELLGRNTYTVMDLVPPVGRRISSQPVTMRVESYCHDCQAREVYGGSHAEDAGTWPAWLVEHLRTLCQCDPSLRRACIACHVPGTSEVPCQIN